MAKAGQANGAGEPPGPPAPQSSESGPLDTMIASLPGLDADHLRLRWRNHLGGIAPVHLPQWLLMRLLAYRIQAMAFGDLDKTTLRRLREPRDRGAFLAVASPFAVRDPATREGIGLKPGSLLVREWNGQMERVMVLEDGFAWNGAGYSSLSRIAKAITGTTWNGHRFFGLKPATSKSPEGGLKRLRRIVVDPETAS